MCAATLAENKNHYMHVFNPKYKMLILSQESKRCHTVIISILGARHFSLEPLQDQQEIKSVKLHGCDLMANVNKLEETAET